MKKILILCSILVIGLTSTVQAIPIYGNATTNPADMGPLGSFSGNFEYTVIDNTSASISLELTNTSPDSNGGYLTAFAFNNPMNLISDITLTGTSSNFSLTGKSKKKGFKNSIKANPFGKFDAGATSTKKSFLGGGKPSGGIGVNETESFVFSLTGIDLDTLTEQDFFDTYSFKTAPGKEQWFAARFRGFNDGGSSKTGADYGTPVPEPGTLILLGSGLLAAAAFSRKRFKK